VKFEIPFATFSSSAPLFLFIVDISGGPASLSPASSFEDFANQTFGLITTTLNNYSSSDDDSDEDDIDSSAISLPNVTFETDPEFSDSDFEMEQEEAPQTPNTTADEEDDGGNDSDGTQDYDVDELVEPADLPNEIIEIADTQVPVPHFVDDEDDDVGIDEAAALPVDVDVDDDDVEIIEQHVEVIDLCTQAPVGPPRAFNTNEIIEVADSPAINPRRNRRAIGPANRATPYAIPTTSPPTSSARRRLNAAHGLNDSQNQSQTERIALTCPVCLESIVKRTPVSTTCGHLFCRACLVAAIKNSKICPMCRGKLTGKAPFHNVHL